MFDSSKAPGKALAKNDPAYSIYLKQAKQADQLAQQANFSVFVEHHPILGFAADRNKSNRVAILPGNAAMQRVLEDIHPQRLFAPDVQILLAGHVHLFEAITFETDHPTQFMVGNGGTLPDENLPDVLPPGMTPFVKAKVAHFNTTYQSGFMTMERATEKSIDWVIKSWDKNGTLMTTCRVSRLKKECS